MAFDIGFIIGADDSEFQAKLKSAGGAADRTLGRFGQLVDARTQGVRKLVGSLSSVTGVLTAGLGIIGAVTIATGLLAAGWSLVAGSSDSSKESMSDWNRVGLETSSILREISGDASETSSTLDRLRSQLNAVTAAQIESGQLEIFTSADPLADQARALRDAIDAERILIGLAQEKKKVDEIAAETLLSVADSLRAQGREIDALVVLEDARSSKRVSAIKARTDLEESRLSQLLIIEQDRHEAILAQIERRKQREETAAQDRVRQQEKIAAAERQREVERVEADRLRTQRQVEDLEVRRLQLQGRDDEADALRVQLDLERRIADIKGREGLSQRDRLEAIKAAEQVAKLELEAIEKRDQEDDETRNLTSGLNLSELLRVQVLGNQPAQQSQGSAVAQSFRKLLPSMDGLTDATESLRRAFETGIQARFGT